MFFDKRNGIIVFRKVIPKRYYMTGETLTIYCHCAHYDLVDEQKKAEVLSAIQHSGVEFEAVNDLCRLSAKRDAVLKKWAAAESIRIYACHPRAVKWLFEAGEAPLPAKGVEFFNMRTGKIEDITASLPKTTSGQKREITFEKDPEWIPWFPVIDYDRCSNCKQCLNFCLFGVYQLDEQGKVEVVNPANCKTNCPACARVCPHGAVIFPKYGESPINGDEIDEEAFRRQKEKEKLDKALSGNIHEAIRRRSRKRFSANADDSDSAGGLTELTSKLDIPADVLNSMTPAEIAGIKKRSAQKRQQRTREDDKSDE